MDNFQELTVDSLNSYFSILSKLGHIKKTDTDRVLVLSFLDDLLYFAEDGFITEEDYNSIINATYCLCGKSCVIQFPKFEVIDGLTHKDPNPFKPRVTEDTILRHTESEVLRTKA